MTTISIIAAQNLNRVIGVNGALPWYCPEDLQYFKDNTKGKPVIMGRKTYESVGFPLPERLNIVITNNKEFKAEGVTVVYSKEEALEVAGDVEEVMVIGGATIYEEFLPITDKIYLTIIDHPVEDGTLFPDLTKYGSIGNILKYEQHRKKDDYSHDLVYCVFEFKKGEQQ